MKSKKAFIQSFLFFAVTAAIIAYFFPREGKFPYQFHEGKPWRYDLLTAPNDFPIYKSDQEIKAEKDSIRARFEPYFRLKEDVSKTVLDSIDDNVYVDILRPLLKTKWPTIHAETDYERSMKLIKFAMSRGFDMALIRRCIDEDITAKVDEG